MLRVAAKYKDGSVLYSTNHSKVFVQKNKGQYFISGVYGIKRFGEHRPLDSEIANFVQYEDKPKPLVDSMRKAYTF